MSSVFRVIWAIGSERVIVAKLSSVRDPRKSPLVSPPMERKAPTVANTMGPIEMATRTISTTCQPNRPAPADAAGHGVRRESVLIIDVLLDILELEQ